MKREIKLIVFIGTIIHPQLFRNVNREPREKVMFAYFPFIKE